MHPNALKESASKFGLTNCDRCGSCAAICPMREVYPDFSRRFSPRSTIARLRLKSAAFKPSLTELLEDAGLWMCLACEACLNVCPQGVEFRDFVAHARELALREGMEERFARCTRCDTPYLPAMVVKALEKYLPEGEPRETLYLCPRCRRRVASRKQQSGTVRYAH